MLRKLLVRVWLGPLPPWTDQWLEHVEALKPYGWDFLLVNDRDDFLARCERAFGFAVNPEPGTRKACEYDPALGEIFADEIAEYDFWGHCNLDAVYGRLDRWLSDEYLSDCDIFGNDPGAICGPLSLYRNAPAVNSLYRKVPGWQRIFKSEIFHGFDEGAFNAVVRDAAAAGELRFKSAFWQSHDKQPGHVPTPRLSLRNDGALVDQEKDEEVMMFHFNRPVDSGQPFGGRRWPVGLTA